MYDLVEIKGMEVFTNSEVIAEGTGNKHCFITTIIQKYEKDFSDVGEIRIEIELLERGEKVYLLNEEQAMLLITYLREDEVVREFKKNLVQQFYKMRRFLIERQSKLWNDTRIANRENRLKETDVIKRLQGYAEQQGSQNSDKLYLVYTRLAKNIVGGNRDSMSVSELNNLTLVENIILRTIQMDMSVGMYYRDIFKDCKERINRFAEMAYLIA